MRFIFLADLHVSSTTSIQADAVRDLVRRIQENVQPGQPVDSVILLGDIAFSGDSTEYNIVEDLLVSPLRATPGIEDAEWIVVPGNHDMNCREVHPCTWNTFPAKVRARYFEESETGIQHRVPVAKRLADYSAFVTRNGFVSPMPEMEVTCVRHRTTAEGSRIAFVVTTTCFQSHMWTSASEKKALPAPMTSLRHVLQQVEDADLVMVIGHHPPTWFFHEDLEPFRSLLDEQATKPGASLQAALPDQRSGLRQEGQRPSGARIGAKVALHSRHAAFMSAR